MREVGERDFGDRFADEYDDDYASWPPSEDALKLLANLAGPGPAVELGVGTGRFAIPLAQAGLAVTGVDISVAMIARLRANAAGLPVTAVVADATEFRLDQPVPQVFSVFNTLYFLAGRERQAAFLRAALRLLTPNGALVLETFPARPERFPPDHEVRVKRVEGDLVVLQVSQHDPDAQWVESRDIRLRHGQPVRIVPRRMYYLSPDQMDELATECGLVLQRRVGDWTGRRIGRAARVQSACTDRVRRSVMDRETAPVVRPQLPLPPLVAWRPGAWQPAPWHQGPNPQCQTALSPVRPLHRANGRRVELSDPVAYGGEAEIRVATRYV